MIESGALNFNSVGIAPSVVAGLALMCHGSSNSITTATRKFAPGVSLSNDMKSSAFTSLAAAATPVWPRTNATNNADNFDKCFRISFVLTNDYHSVHRLTTFVSPPRLAPTMRHICQLLTVLLAVLLT